MRRTTAFTGEADGKTGLFSIWLKFNAGTGFKKIIFADTSSDVEISKNTNDNLDIQIYATNDSTLALRLRSMSNNLADGNWHSIIAAWDVNTGSTSKNKVIIDGVDSTELIANIDLNLFYTRTSWKVSNDDTNGLDADLSEMWWGPNQWLDLSIASNVQKFRSVAGHPVDLGANGSTPTGSTPIIYIPGLYTAVQAGTNSSGAGNFNAVGGTFTAATPP